MLSAAFAFVMLLVTVVGGSSGRCDCSTDIQLQKPRTVSLLSTQTGKPTEPGMVAVFADLAPTAQCSCGPGMYFDEGLCNRSRTYACRFCSKNTWTDARDSTKCEKCGSCDASANLIVSRPCTTTSDVICACKPGYYKDSASGTCVQCGYCFPEIHNFAQRESSCVKDIIPLTHQCRQTAGPPSLKYETLYRHLLHQNKLDFDKFPNGPLITTNDQGYQIESNSDGSDSPENDEPGEPTNEDLPASYVGVLALIATAAFVLVVFAAVIACQCFVSNQCLVPYKVGGRLYCFAGGCEHDDFPTDLKRKLAATRKWQSKHLGLFSQVSSSCLSLSKQAPSDGKSQEEYATINEKLNGQNFSELFLKTSSIISREHPTAHGPVFMPSRGTHGRLPLGYDHIRQDYRTIGSMQPCVETGVAAVDWDGRCKNGLISRSIDRPRVHTHVIRVPIVGSKRKQSNQTVSGTGSSVEALQVHESLEATSSPDVIEVDYSTIPVQVEEVNSQAGGVSVTFSV